MVKKKVLEAVESQDVHTKRWRGTFSAAKMAYDTGELRQAETLITQAREMARDLPEHTFAENATEIGKAAIYLATKRLKEAKDVLGRVISSLEGEPDNALKELQAVALRFHAQALQDAGDGKAAEADLHKSIDILRKLGPDASVQLAYSMCDLCGLFLTQKKYADAELKITEAMFILGNVLGTDNPEYQRADMIYASCLPMSAESHVEAAAEGIGRMRYFYGAKHPNITRAVNHYFKVLEEQGDKAKLEEARANFGVAPGKSR